MSQTRRQFIQTSTLAGLGVLAARKLTWAFGNSPITIRKFVKRLPSLGLDPLAANEDGLYVPVAQPLARLIRPPRGLPYKVDYYKFQIAPYRQKLHSGLPGDGARFYGYQDITGGRNPDYKYLGGVIIARKDNPVQITFVNKLPNRHILPVDETEPVSGVGFGLPNRAAVHFHGGDIPWISDGGPFDWFSSVHDPGGTRYGSSFLNNVVPGASGGPGEAEYYYPMNQSARLCWYHDHAFGLTRQNAYAGVASALLIVDDFEESLINLRILPSLPGYLRYGIPLIIQDKTFWDGRDTGYPVMGRGVGDLWYPWQYEAARWDVGRFDTGKDPTSLPVSTVPEFFADTMMVNGCPYPYLPVEPRHYRFRILNASQGRFLNLQLYYAQSRHLNNPDSGEADLTNAGPRIIQIGTEGGFLRSPAVLNDPPTQIGISPTNGNATHYNLLLGPAERADVVIDFSACPVGSNLILYTDAPAPFPGGDAINDYITLNSDPSGPPVSTPPAFGPNTRTIMQFRVSPFDTLGQGTKPDPASLGLLEKLAVAKSGVNPFPAIDEFVLSALQKLHVKERWLTLNEDFDEYGRLLQRLGTTDPASLSPARDLANPTGKWLGVPLEAAPTEIVNEGDLEIWHIVNTTADTHPMHFHLVNVQVLQRYPFDVTNYSSGNPAPVGPARGPDANEKGWKETVRMNPNEVTTVVMRFTMAKVPFPVPNSPRLKSFGINGAEYVWHCHILEHEEHDMMRPMVVIPK